MVSDARILVCISAHYAPGRVQFLDLVLAAIADWPVAEVKVVLLTNDGALFEEPAITARRGQFSRQGWELTHLVCGPLDHPYHLTWAHKPLIPQWLAGARADTDFFLYIEDDLVISSENISYLVRTLPVLRPHGLIPSFLRYERVGGRRILVDFTEPQLIHNGRSLKIGAWRFVCPANPYWAGFVLDRTLAAEYVETASYDRERSASVIHWEVRERSAMGLTWESPPTGFRSRCGAPVSAGRPADECLIWHAAQNYNADALSRFGTLEVNEAFVGHDIRLYGERAIRKLKRAAMR